MALSLAKSLAAAKHLSSTQKPSGRGGSRYRCRHRCRHRCRYTQGQYRESVLAMPSWLATATGPLLANPSASRRPTSYTYTFFSLRMLHAANIFALLLLSSCSPALVPLPHPWPSATHSTFALPLSRTLSLLFGHLLFLAVARRLVTSGAAAKKRSRSRSSQQQEGSGDSSKVTPQRPDPSTLAAVPRPPAPWTNKV
ncbi:hypothetical protein BD289DRAFT_158528 [Coniella lustricola]|uniref:Uncharacterized protein n=1 Tax=Coniella lustricola TaxID=2025994 RepID=A0A2T3AEF5_9PEZI|nr:hypothetical protein BD289DRAFT_158528 [Coniella lustricola]